MTSAELIAELQSTRPVADAGLRDHVRSIAATSPRPKPSPFRRFSTRRFSLVAVPATAVVLLGVAGIAGVLDSGPKQPSLAISRDAAKSIVGADSTADLAPELKAGASAAPGTTPAPTTGRAQRYSAQLTLTVKDVDALSSATQQALQITRDLGGYLVTATYATSDSGFSSLTLKVPTANVQDAIVRLSGLGTIAAQRVQIDDLQGQLDDLQKRELALRTQIASLSSRLATKNLDAAARATLTARRDAARRELAQITAARGQVASEARFATIQLGLQTRESASVPAVPSRWDRAVDRAVEILAIEATALLYALVLVGPVALLALLAWFGRRGLRRRQDEQLLSAP